MELEKKKYLIYSEDCVNGYEWHDIVEATDETEACNKVRRFNSSTLEFCEAYLTEDGHIFVSTHIAGQYIELSPEVVKTIAHWAKGSLRRSQEILDYTKPLPI